MSLPWDHETGKALRAARAVLAPVDIAWFEAAHAPAFLDPAAAMERIFGQLLGSDAEPAANADIEPEAAAAMRRREPHLGARAPTELAARPSPVTAPARRIARDPHARPPVSVRPHRPVAGDDASAPVQSRDVDAIATARSVAGQPPTKPGAVPDASPRRRRCKPARRIPDERATSRRKPSARQSRNVPDRTEYAVPSWRPMASIRVGTARPTDPARDHVPGARAARYPGGLPGPRHAGLRGARRAWFRERTLRAEQPVPFEVESTEPIPMTGLRRKRRDQTAQDESEVARPTRTGRSEAARGSNRTERLRRRRTAIDGGAGIEETRPDGLPRAGPRAGQRRTRVKQAYRRAVRRTPAGGRAARPNTPRVRPPASIDTPLRLICRRRVHAARPDAEVAARSFSRPVRGALARAGDPPPWLHREGLTWKCRWKSPE